METAHLEPGEDVTVEVVANSNGNVATEGDLVAIAGETSNHTQVKLVDTAGTAEAILERQAEEYDSSTSYSAGEVVGTGKATVRKPVDWMTPTGTYTPTAGDLVVGDVGGTVRAYDSAGGDTVDMILGRVWGTHQRGTQYAAGEITVARYK